MLFVQGACGNINPLGGVRDSYANVRWLGTMLAGEVIRVYEGLMTEPLRTVKAVSTSLSVPLEPLPKAMQPEEHEVHLQKLADEHVPWPWEVDAREEEGKLSMPVEMQALRLNDAVLVGAAGEVFVEIGLDVKNRSPLPNTFFAGYTNGCIGYIPVPEAYPEGGYEVQMSYIGYRLPAPVSPRTAGLIADTALELIGKL